MSNEQTARALMEIEKECARHNCRRQAAKAVGAFFFCEMHAAAMQAVPERGDE